MKRSEFVKELEWGKGDPETRGADFAADLAEEAGVQWDPEEAEEAEVPEWVWVDDCILVPEGRTNMDTSREEDEANALEAAARYNTMGRLLRPWSTWGSDDIQRVLDEERERLKEGG